MSFLISSKFSLKQQCTSGVVPDAVVGQLHGVGVLRLLKVLVGMATDVPATPNMATDQADPQVLLEGEGEAREEKT